MIKSKKVSIFVLRSIAPFKKYIFIHLIVVILTSINLSLLPFVSKILLNKIIATEAYLAVERSSQIMIFMGILLLLPAILSRVSEYSWTCFLPKIKHKITRDSVAKLLNNSNNFFENNFSGSLVNKVRDLFNSTPKIIEIFLYNFVGGALSIIIACYVLYSINHFFGIGLILWVLVILPISYRSALLTNRLSMSVANQQGRIMGNIVDVFGNIQNIKLFNGAKHELVRIDKFQKKYNDLYRKRGGYLNQYYSLLGLISSLYFILCFVVLISLYSRGDVTVGDFVLIFGINNFLHAIIQDSMKQIRNFLEEYSIVKEALEIVERGLQIKDGKARIEITKGEIIFDKVKFSYSSKTTLFTDKSVKIEAGQKVGLVGHSGSGKSTFINLLLRFYDVENGKILIDGQDISKVSQESLREAITLIPQEPILFHRNLIDNICYGNKQHLTKIQLHEKVVEAAINAYADGFICEMPEGYFSQVGERGIKLSGGQRQRIAIARAFFKNAPILILDEATSQVDSVAENIIQKSLENLMQNKTTLVIAHRLSTLQKMDRILVFNHGKIVEDGTHEELIRLDGYYKKLWSAQSSDILTYHIEKASAVQLISM